MTKDQEQKYRKILRTKKFWRLVDDGAIKYQRWWSERSTDDYIKMFNTLESLAQTSRFKFDDRVIAFVRAIVMGADALTKPLKLIGSTLADKLEEQNRSIPVEEEALRKLQNLNDKERKSMAKKKKKVLSDQISNKVKQDIANKAKAKQIIQTNIAKKRAMRSEVNKARNALIAKHSGKGAKQVARTIIGSTAGIPGMIAANLHNYADTKNYNKDWKDMKNQTKEIKQRKNDPSWYTDLGLHTTFSVPDGWSDNVAIPVTSRGGLPLKADVITLKMIYNPNSESNAIIQRLTQKLTLLKAVRGLSNVEYDIYDIYHKEQATNWFINEYYAALAALKATSLYAVNKSRWPRPFVTAKGFNFDQVVLNAANLREFLINFAKFISTISVSGHIKEKLEFLNLSVVPDSNDYSIATYYNYDVLVDPSIVALNVEYDSAGTLTNITTANSYSVRTNLTTWMTNINTAMRLFQTCRRYSLIQSDEIGAYGNNCLHTPNLDFSPLQISAYNVDTLSQIQNTSICNFEGSLIIEDGTHIYTELTPGNANVIINIPGTWTVNPPVNVSNYKDWVDKGTLIGTSTSAQYVQGTIYGAVPPLPGYKGTGAGDVYNVTSWSDYRVSNPDNFWDQDVINKQTYGGSEGQLLDMMNHRAMLQYIYLTAGSGSGDVTFHQYYDAFAFCCYDVIGYCVDKNNNYTTHHIVHSVRSLSDIINGTAMLTQLAKFKNDNIDIATQADYFPLITNIYYGYEQDGKGDTVVTDADVIYDWNIIGVISMAAWKNAKKYIAYSLNALNYKAEGKRIDNIRDVYND